jgi:hypothetical protein
MGERVYLDTLNDHHAGLSAAWPRVLPGLESCLASSLAWPRVLPVLLGRAGGLRYNGSFPLEVPGGGVDKVAV